MRPYVFVVCGLIIISSLLNVREAAAQDGLEVGTEVYYFNYKEPGFMEDQGVFYGINAGYSWHFSDWDIYDNTAGGNGEAPFMVRLDGRFAFGQVDYTSTGTGDINNIDDYVFETRLVGGYDFSLTGQSVLTPYVGFGYRYLNDDTSGKTTSTGAFGYERESNYLYVPIGVDLSVPVSGEWHFNANVEFDVFIQGEQKSHLGDAIAGLNTVNNDQNDGYGARGSIRLTKENENTALFLEPFIRYWHIDDSEVSSVTYNGVLVGYGHEPENKTLEAGAKIGLRF